MGSKPQGKVGEDKERAKSLAGERIGERLRSLGKSIQDLADETEILRPALSEMIAGKRIANAHHLARIAKALKCTPNDLVPPELVGLKLWWPAVPVEDGLNGMSVSDRNVAQHHDDEDDDAIPEGPRPLPERPDDYEEADANFVRTAAADPNLPPHLSAWLLGRPLRRIDVRGLTAVRHQRADYDAPGFWDRELDRLRERLTAAGRGPKGGAGGGRAPAPGGAAGGKRRG